MAQHQNRLAAEQSPYLLQHKDNPVNWFAWGEDAFAAARAANKPIFLSIGYATCYWCHMMEKDAFEREDVASVMNEHFINVKVDREEHPDVDQIYMDAVMGMTGRGGWPMSVFLTPDLKPFFGGTFFWRPQFLHILARVHEEWTKNPDNVRRVGDEIAASLAQNFPASNSEVDDASLRAAFHELRGNYDGVYGGFGMAPKFPHAGDARFLLRLHHGGGAVEPLEMAKKSLKEMANGGLYDHLGGGFHRYSTDERWFAPHFEKMLYDNALLIDAYVEAFQITGDAGFARVAKESCNYVLRDMQAPDGGFYAAEDAGDAGEEGDFYVWTDTALAATLDENELAAVRAVYRASPQGNWEHGKNILHRGVRADLPEFDDEVLVSARRKLIAARQKRTRPRRDDKILTSWNGLMIGALAKAARVLERPEYALAAARAAHFIKRELWRDDILLRRFCDGDARFNATLDDHAFLIDGLIRLYEADGDSVWMEWAATLQKKQDDIFKDESDVGYFFTPQDAHGLIVRKKSWHDGATPSGNAIALVNLLRLAAACGSPLWHEHALLLAKRYAGLSAARPAGFAFALIGLDVILQGTKTAVVSGEIMPPEGGILKRLLDKEFSSLMLVLRASDATDAPFLARGKASAAGVSAVYFCEAGLCLPSQNDAAHVLYHLKPRHIYHL